MKRRNFLASLAAVVAAPKILERVTQPGVDPREFTGLQTKQTTVKGKRMRVVRTGLPAVGWRPINAGIVPIRPTYTYILIEDET